MILSACFYIDNTRWFKEQFELSRCLFNQARYFFREHYDKTKSIVNQTDLEKVLRTQDTKLNPNSRGYLLTTNTHSATILFTGVTHRQD